MRRPVALRLQAALGTLALAAATGVALSMPEAAAAAGGATGYATQNGGTTGGAGGRTVRVTTGTAIHEALCGRADSSTPITIEVEGTINHGNTSKVSGDSCNTAADKIELKQISNVTLVGVGSGAVFDQLGIHIRESSNIIIQNVTVRNVKKSGSPTSNGGDAIGMESDVRNIWVDHSTLEASGGESEGYDGLFDMKADTQYVTLSYSVLRNSGRGGLIGSSESDVSNGYVTFHHNLYENIDSRAPLLRGGTAHMYNNHYRGLAKSGINSRAGAKAKVDNNYFEDSRDVLGTFYTDAAGSWQVSGNIYDNVTWSEPGEDNNPAGPDPQLRRAWIGGPGAWKPVAYRAEEGFNPADAAPLPDGGAVVLERRFSVVGGFGGRVVRLDAAQLRAADEGAVLEGEEILRLSSPLPTENYEALAVARHGGRTLLAVLADDNENMLQRSLLLLFAFTAE